MAGYIQGYDADAVADTRQKKQQRKRPITGSYGFSAMERRLKKRMPPVGDSKSSDSDLGAFGRSYSPGTSSFSRGSRRY